MSSEGNFQWKYLKNVANTLDSYRIRALIDAREDIKNAGIYNEQQYSEIFFRMFDEEILKYTLFEFIKNNSKTDIKILKEFNHLHKIDLKKALSLLELLETEGIIKVNLIHEETESEDKNDLGINVKDFSVVALEGDSSQIKPIYEPVKTIFDSKICSGCGLCAGICPMNCIQIYNGFGKLDEEKCIRCGLCYFICPRSYLPNQILNMYQEDANELKTYSKIGFYQESYSARTKIKEISEHCQDGGISSTCLYYLLDNDKVDLSIGAKMSNTKWRPEPIILKTKDDVIQTLGTKYVNNPNLQILNQTEVTGKKIAVVGVPCQMQALLKSNIYNIGLPPLNAIEYRIGIFCMESFSYESLLKICEKLEVPINDAVKMDINKGKFFVYTQNETLEIPIKEISNLAREDCEVCFDLTSEAADISVGSIGSPSGWNTVIIRTPKGKELYKSLLADDLIESKDFKDVKPGLPLLEKIANSKRTKSTKYIDQKKSENKRFPHY